MDKLKEIKKKLTPEYIAGFFDGEGCVWVLSTRGTHALRVSITQVDSAILYGIKELYGGKVTTWRSKTNEKDVSKWEILNGKDAIIFLEKIYPSLIIKKIQVELAMVFMNLPWRQIGRGGLRKKKTKEQIEIDDMFAYSIKIAKPRHWDNYTDINSDSELVDHVFLKVCEQFN